MKIETQIRRRKFLAGAVTTIAAASVCGPTFPQASRKVTRIIVAFPPGNTADAIARLIEPQFSQVLGEPVIIENMSGAGGRLGLAAVARAVGDGHTIGSVNGGTMIVHPHTLKELPYSTTKDFRLVALTGWNYNILVSSNAAPFATVQEMVSWARENPGQLSVATNGEGSFPHFWFEDLSRRAGFKYIHVPYKGASAIATDIVGGQVMVTANSLPSFHSFIKAGRVRLLAITNKTRDPDYPTAPTLNELYPGFVVNGWFAMAVPAKTPKAIIDRLNSTFNRILVDPRIVSGLKNIGLFAEQLTPEFLENLVATDFQRYGALAKGMGLKPQ